MSASADSPSARLIRFAKLVQTMRSIQLRHMEGDSSVAVLQLLTDLEARVDLASAWVLSREQDQLSLFPSAGERPGAYRSGAEKP